MWISRVGVCAAVGLAFGVAAGADAPKAALGMKTLVYKKVGDLKLEADVYRVDDGQARPVLLWLHGGALIHGDRRGVPQDLRDLCRTEGYILVSADYRLAPETKLPQIIEDLRDLIKWVSEKGPALFQADVSKVVVAGGSAGGYLTMMAGLGGGDKQVVAQALARAREFIKENLGPSD